MHPLQCNSTADRAKTIHLKPLTPSSNRVRDFLTCQSSTLHASPSSSSLVSGVPNAPNTCTQTTTSKTPASFRASILSGCRSDETQKSGHGFYACTCQTTPCPWIYIYIFVCLCVWCVSAALIKTLCLLLPPPPQTSYEILFYCVTRDEWTSSYLKQTDHFRWMMQVLLTWLKRSLNSIMY